MRKLIYALALGGFAMTACNNPSYKIDGTIGQAAENSAVYLQKAEGRNTVTVDSAIVKNGKFTFTGRQDTLAVRYLVYKNENGEYTGTEVFLDNSQIKVSLGSEVKLSGTAVNDSLQKFNDLRLPIYKRNGEIYEKVSTDSLLTEKQRDELIAEYEKNEESLKEIAKATIKKNVANQLAAYLLPMYSNEYEMDELSAVLDEIPAAMSDANIKSLKSYVTNVSNTSEGKHFVDFTMKDTEGKEVKLSDYMKGYKYTLVDFWASWCRPCLRSMPYLVDLYKEYHEKGLNIVGVSLDNHEDAWKSTIKSMHLDWDHMSDLKGWESENAALYGVRAIPFTVLVNEEGIIVARNLHGAEIEDTIKKLFSGK